MIEHRRGRLELAWTGSVPLERLWAVWTDPRHLSNWFVDRAEGVAERGETFTWHWDSLGISVRNKVLAAEPLKHFALGFGDMALELKFLRSGGLTGMKLINSGIPDSDEGYQGTRSGWLLGFASMRKYLSTYWDRPKHQVFVRREAQFEYPRTTGLYRMPGREVWLPGEPAVLEDSGTEVALEWVEREGILELKAFPMGGKRFIGMRATSWDGKGLDAWAGPMGEALDRLQPLLS